MRVNAVEALDTLPALRDLKGTEEARSLWGFWASARKISWCSKVLVFICNMYIYIYNIYIYICVCMYICMYAYTVLHGLYVHFCVLCGLNKVSWEFSGSVRVSGRVAGPGRSVPNS